MSHISQPLLPEDFTHRANIPPGSGRSRKQGILRTWFATSADIRPTQNRANIKWGIHWYTPVSIIMLVVLGTASAVAHHIFYSRLNNTTVGGEAQQRWSLWIGSGFSFVSKVALVAAVGIARTQWVWLTLRRKWFTLDQLDILFGVITDPTRFFNLAMLQQTTTATVIAIVMWLIPIAAILTPGTLSVYSTNRTEVFPCTVPSLLFPFDPNPQDKSLINVTKNASLVPFAAWHSDKTSIRKHTTTTRAFMFAAYSGTIARSPDLPSVNSANLTTLNNVCGAHCIYSVNFLAPGMRCPEFTSWNSTNTIYHNPSQFMRSAFYRAVIVEEGILVGINYTLSTPESPIFFLCKPSITRYTVQNAIIGRRFNEPVITNVEPVHLSEFRPTSKYPDTKFLPQVLFDRVVYSFLEGNVSNQGSRTLLDQTPFLGSFDIDLTTVGSSLELMAQKMIVSLLSIGINTGFGKTYILDISAVQETTCTTMEELVLYRYSATTLVFVYGLALCCTLVAAVAGIFALGKNGMASQGSISTIIRTTRNPTLDQAIVGGDRLGGVFMSEELEKLELQFGMMRADGKQTSLCAMGVKGEISTIKRD